MHLFIISDIHGMYDEFEELLTYWQDGDLLVLLGDLVDRGPRSLDVLRRAMALQQAQPERVLFCQGNHDVMLLDYMASPLVQKPFYTRVGGAQTLHAFLQAAPADVAARNSLEQAAFFATYFAKELAFLAAGQTHAIVGDVLLTHAGFNSFSSSLADSTDDDFLHSREHYRQPNTTPYVNVFGHSPVRQIHGSDDLWVSHDSKYIGIDGGCAFGGQLNAVRLTQQGEIVDTYCVKRPTA